MMDLVSELKRRNVIRMAGLYLVGAWLLVQVAGTVLPWFRVSAPMRSPANESFHQEEGLSMYPVMHAEALVEASADGSIGRRLAYSQFLSESKEQP